MDILAIIGFVLTIVGTIIAVAQITKNKQLEEALERIKRQYDAEIWTLLGIVTRTFDTLDTARNDLVTYLSVGEEERNLSLLREALIGIQSARRGTVDQYRNLLKEASLSEENYDLETVKKWVITGRLENAWRVKQAIRLLSSSETPDFPISEEDLLEKYRPLRLSSDSKKFQLTTSNTQES